MMMFTQKYVEALRTDLAEVQRQLKESEALHSQTIDERDHHEESINQIAAALGLECEWSNLCDVGHECINEASNLQQQLAASQQRERGIVDLLNQTVCRCTYELQDRPGQHVSSTPSSRQLRDALYSVRQQAESALRTLPEAAQASAEVKE